MKKVKIKTCKNCNTEYVQYNSFQKCNSPSCNNEIKSNQKKQGQQIRIEPKKRREKSIQTLKKECQTVFNRYIRERDKFDLCISCQGSLGKKYDAGHFYSVGSSSFLRYHQWNVNAQCVKCNMFLHGNLLNYRKFLEKKIGTEALIYLEKNAMKEKRYSSFELKEMIELYKNLTKNLTK
jgi:hypothetical protein